MEEKESIIHNRKMDGQVVAQDKKLPANYLDDERLELLKDLCLNLNPYEELSLEDKFKLQEFGVTDFSNPFAITNRLLFLLEDNLQFRTEISTESTNNDT